MHFYSTHVGVGFYVPVIMFCTIQSFVLILSIIWESILMGHSIGVKRKYDPSVAKYHPSSRQPIAVHNLLETYENEHYRFHQREASEDNVMEWPLLEKKDVDKCCLKYIHHIIPTVELDGVTGIMKHITLQYRKKSIHNFHTMKNKIAMVTCKRWNINAKYYYMTRAPELDCVYALLRVNTGCTTFNIVNKHCGFVWPTKDSKVLKYGNRREIIEKLHKWTGQPIAKNEYIYEYEQEHQELFKNETKPDSVNLPWPYIIEKKNLDEYCHQYMQRCNPRKLGNVKGIQTKGLLRYQNSSAEGKTQIKIVVVKCVVQRKVERLFYLTRAHTNNCVYALLRRERKESPFEIIFKHCDFEELEEKNSEVREDRVLADLNISSKNEMKEERSDTLEISIVPPIHRIKKERSDSLKPLQFFPTN